MPREDTTAASSQLVAQTTEARALLSRSVRAVDDHARRKGGSVGTTAVWVPDLSTGEVMGVLMAMRMGLARSFAPNPEGFVARNWRKDYGGWRLKITERSAEIIHCPAGPTVIETIVCRIRGERTVQAYSSYFVFPADGTPETVQLSFNTIHLDLLVELTVLGRTIADSLQITTGPATS